MPVTDDEIREKYLERAIRELNLLSREHPGVPHCPRGALMPVLGSGHPQADIMLLKYAPRPSEIEEGVAFYGRSGTALMKSLRRLQIDPLAVYGTLFVEVPGRRHLARRPRLPRARRRGDRDRRAEDHRRDGRGRARKRSTSSSCRSRARSHRASARSSSSRRRSPRCYVPNIDARSTRSDTKRAFWAAFRVLGDW